MPVEAKPLFRPDFLRTHLDAFPLANRRAEYGRSIDPGRALAAEALTPENEIRTLVNAAYGLTPEEVALMWQTAPPRMPIAKTACKPESRVRE